MSVNFTNSQPDTTPEAGTPGEKSHRVNMALPTPLYEQLQVRVAQTGLSIPMLVRFAVVEYLK